MNIFKEYDTLVFEINGVEVEETELTDYQFINCVRAIIGLDPLEERGRGGKRNQSKVEED